jgi:hypothetical protein
VVVREEEARVTQASLNAHRRAGLLPSKVSIVYEFVPSLPRNARQAPPAGASESEGLQGLAHIRQHLVGVGQAGE